MEIGIDARVVERDGAEVGQFELRVHAPRHTRSVVHVDKAELVEPDLPVQGPRRPFPELVLHADREIHDIRQRRVPEDTVIRPGRSEGDRFWL